MPYIPRVQSIINKADACSAGNKKAGLVNTSDYPNILRSFLKSKTSTNILFSATSGNCCNGSSASSNTTNADYVFSQPSDETLHIDGTYSYTSADFGSQDYVDVNGILHGVFIIPLFDNSVERKQIGHLSWDILAETEDVTNYGSVDVPCHDHLILTLGMDDSAYTCHGSALSVSTGGYYDEGKTYEFCLYGCNGEKTKVVITNVGEGKREVVVERINDNTHVDAVVDGTYSYTSADFGSQDYVDVNGILHGVFIIPLFDNAVQRTQIGYLSWDILAETEDVTNYGSVDVPCHDHIIVSFGMDNDAYTCHGSALSVSTGGYYDEGKVYEFCVYGRNNEEMKIAITTLEKEREKKVESISNYVQTNNSIDGTYSYTSADFGSQDYVDVNGILHGVFIIPLFDNAAQRTQIGYLSWDILAETEDVTDYGNVSVSCHDHLIVSFGMDNDAYTCHGSALSISTGGYYDEGKDYEFCVYGDNGEEIKIVITNVGGGKREMVVQKLSN